MIHVLLAYLVRLKLYNFYEMTKHTKILFWLTGHSGTLWNDLSTIARYRFFDSIGVKKKNHNQERKGRKFEPKFAFIIIYEDPKGSEK